MVSFKKIGNEYILCRHRENRSGAYREPIDWFVVRYSSNVHKHYCGLISGLITTPKELVGKRVRIKLEVIKGGKDGSNTKFKK
jgi:hypothetical protein